MAGHAHNVRTRSDVDKECNIPSVLFAGEQTKDPETQKWCRKRISGAKGILSRGGIEFAWFLRDALGRVGFLEYKACRSNASLFPPRKSVNFQVKKSSAQAIVWLVRMFNVACDSATSIMGYISHISWQYMPRFGEVAKTCPKYPQRQHNENHIEVLPLHIFIRQISTCPRLRTQRSDWPKLADTWLRCKL